MNSNNKGLRNKELLGYQFRPLDSLTTERYHGDSK